MKDLFIYDVNGEQFEDTIAFGDAWKKAKAAATTEHCGIRRADIRGDKVKYLIYVKAGDGGVFLDERYCGLEDMKIF